MPDGVKALLDVILQTNNFFREKFCFRHREANACSFQLFFGLAERFTSNFTWNKENLNYFFPVNSEERHFQKVFLSSKLPDKRLLVFEHRN